MDQQISLNRRFLIIFSIVFAGEMIFSLPFHVARFFRPTLLDVFQISNTQLGDIFAFYGTLAMLAYFPGGMLADKFSARILMSFSLLSTALGGLYFAQIPSSDHLVYLYGWWGVTTILLFWSSMIKLTRQWGGSNTQGKAFGILDGGRGLVAAAMASIAVFILSYGLPGNVKNSTLAQQTDALQSVILFYSAMTLLAAIITWLVIPKDQHEVPLKERSARLSSIHAVTTVLTQPIVWLQAFIVLTAYCAYKSLDYFGLYASSVMGLNEVESSRLMANATYLRPVAAVVAGIVADKVKAGRVISWSFFLLAACYGAFALLEPNKNSNNLIIELNFLLTFFLVFAIRGVYFALLEESKLSGKITGTAVGMISVIGYTPDIFFAPVAGRILDASPGIVGFTQLYSAMGIIAIIGLLLTLTLARTIR
ncbi:MAG: MFS transporter [Psychrobium sp.]|nr:MFS transporter [Psychrobium sp.]